MGQRELEMNRTLLVRALFAGTAMMLSTAALAQAEQQPDTSDAAADAVIAQATAVDDAQAKIELLQAQVEALQESLAQVQASIVKTTPSWKGGPLLEDKEAGWSFKPRGRIMYDVGFVSNPDDNNPANGVLAGSSNLGFNSRVRRIRLGAEGTIPGGFGYKFEMDFANAAVGFGDAIITYAPANRPYSLTIGNHETHNSLDQITSSRFLNYLERSAFNDAFVNTRRIGISGGLVNKANTLRLNAGLFAAHSIDSSFDNDGFIAAARATYSPLLGTSQLHLGANVQQRRFQSNNGATTSISQGSPSTNQLARYRARPFTQTTDVRFVDTGNFAARGDRIIGVEAGGIFKSLHLAAEAQYLKSDAYQRGDTFSSTEPFDAFAGPTALVASGDPSFWGGYVEAGYFITGETRGYKNGAWDRTKVLKPFSQGGWGALQVNGRVDYLDLDSSRLKNGFTNNFVTGAATASNSLTRGGKQFGLIGSVVWLPEDYFRIYLQYARAQITGGPNAAVAEPGSTKPLDKRKYGVDVVAARASIDF